ncbi:MAG: UDP-glucose 4-epimerase GalE [Candidatus Diapherotrites archaeon CG10_big_fil_rev_8_21_14_0_10_31_34]|nr:MAG: UDP-glucose 4-epimerase GalE [Candidatus Diapherotrites archaeon CG10_big_fil_rev_8_21_14_0_10_31_34]
MRILVTGGAGFIGSNAVDFLVEKGFEVNVIDDLSRGFKKLLNKKAVFFEGSFGDKKVLVKALEGVEAVIHFASFIYPEESIKKPAEYYKNNVVNTVVLLEEMRKRKINKMVFSSSCSVYGEPKSIPVKETNPLNPITPYGETKKVIEKILELYFHSFGIKSICLRYFNPFGPKELHKPEIHAIPNFIKAVLQDKPIKVFGDGNQIRDFIFVEDLAKAHVLALNKLDEIGFDVFNVGSGKGNSVNQCIKTIFDLLGKKTEIIFLAERKGDPKKLVAETAKIESRLNWKPETDFELGLKKTIEFFKEIN